MNALLVVRCADCSYVLENETSGLASCEDSEGSSDKSSPSPSRGVGASAPQLQAKKGKKIVISNKQQKNSNVIRDIQQNPPYLAVFLMVEPLNPLYTDLSGLLKGKAFLCYTSKG